MSLPPETHKAWRILTVTNMFPSAESPAYGAFVAAQMASIAEVVASVEIEFIDGRGGMWRYATAVSRIRRLAASGRFDLVHAHYGLSGFTASAQPLPLVVSYCGDDLLGTPGKSGAPTLKSRIGVEVSQAVARRADAIICKSAAMQARLRSPKDRERAHIIPNGVDTRVFCPGNKEVARKKMGQGGNEPLILFPTSSKERRKRYDLAEAAVRALRARGLPGRLWVVYGVPQSTMPDAYRAADCLLVTSDWEGSPNGVKEALSCDLPVVSVDVGDVRQWVGMTQGCQLVDRAPEAIATGLEHVLRRAMRVDGSAVRREVSHTRVAAQVLEAYREAIVRRRQQGRAC